MPLHHGSDKHMEAKRHLLADNIKAQDTSLTSHISENQLNLAVCLPIFWHCDDTEDVCDTALLANAWVFESAPDTYPTRRMLPTLAIKTSRLLIDLPHS